MFLLSSRNVLHLLAMATFLHICQARSLANESSMTNTTDGSLWQPNEGTRDEWMACHGMPKDVCERTKIKKQELQKILAKKFGLDLLANPHDSPPIDSEADQCIMFTEEQLDMLIAEAENEENATSTHRSKRTLIDFKKNPFNKWSMPIPYMFDGTHDNNQKAKIRVAFQHWTDNTCIRFTELATNARFSRNYILMTKNKNNGCNSNVGRINFIPQQINLASNCVESFAVILHEIGHSLGLFHEQSRIDRNDAVRILWSNIKMSAWSQYMQADTDAVGLPYNYGSVMHYGSKNAFAAIAGVDTMIALEPLYQMNMGQYVDLSFRDVKMINLAYCKGICTIPLSQPCQRGGYLNPNNCYTCICPDGFSGRYCNEIAPPKNANCGGILNLVPVDELVIKSPGFDGTGYSLHQECTWWIKAPENYKLQLTFSGIFSILCWQSGCNHWVEIKYKKDLGLEGARFCCYSRPNGTMISESNEMMVIFRSDLSVGPEYKSSQRGFQATVHTFPRANTLGRRTASTPASTPVSTQRTSSPTITIRTPTQSNRSTTSTSTNRASTAKSSASTKLPTSTKTTTRASTLAPNGNRKSLFRCSFETTSSGNSLCGMTQDKTDQFDWTVYHDRKPSDATGPDAPYDGNSYIYIEASSPRKPNDEARLFFPRLNFTGEVCVNFYYHMFSFCIQNNLKLVRITNSQRTEVWTKSGQIGKRWIPASVGVNLSLFSQLQFIGSRGSDYNSGDTGLDKIEVTSGPCALNSPT